jgi:CheY-like chemotaxis protein/tRNA A-37 threonylcarbamoyl transferase component Bud32
MARILLCDDDMSLCDVLYNWLIIDKHDVETANDGLSGYNKLAANSFDIIVLDWDMPGMTGPEICKKYRSAGGQVPILLLTGRVEDEEKVEGLDAGADDYLTKPFSLKEFNARLRSLLRRSNVTAVQNQNQEPANPEIESIRVCISCGKQYDAADSANELCSIDRSSTVLISVKKMIGKLVGNRYQIVSLLGVGAWSEIYLACDMQTRENVAIKILHTHLAADPLKVARFKREADVLLHLQHGSLAKVFAQCELDNKRPCLIMEYLEGLNLEQALSTYGPMNLAQAREIFIPVCEALAVAHDKGLVHRDLKPSNVFIVQENGKVKAKILDFGLAKMSDRGSGTAGASLTQTGEVLGTPAYMSPEQCRGYVLDCRSDLYSLGCLVYEALTGTRAIPGKTAFEAMSNQISRYPDPINDAYPKAQVTPQVEDIIFKLLAKDPEDRYATAREFAADFKNA